MSNPLPAQLMTVGNGVAVDPTGVVATRVHAEGISQVRIDGVWIDAWAYTGRPDALIEDLNRKRILAGVAGGGVR